MIRLAVVGALAGVLIAALASLVVYPLIRADLAAGVYRQRLADLAGQYESLRERYNSAVRKTAVTELLVEDGRLAVMVRTADGVLQRIDTPFNPAGEVYVDYIVAGGRLWIRRVFDARTPPEQGLVIDPAWGQVDWDASDARYGKAVYRALSEGRWVVTVTGDGSLGLARAAQPVDLHPIPEVRDYAAITAETDAHVRAIGASEVWRRLFGRPTTRLASPAPD